MKSLMKIKIGGGTSKSGLFPVAAGDMIEDLIKVLQEYGGDPETWNQLNPHVEVIGKGSTVMALQGEDEMAPSLEPLAEGFIEDAHNFALLGRGQKFIEEHCKGNSAWGYIELAPVNDHSSITPVRLNRKYREKYKARQEERNPITSHREYMYATVHRVGGKNPTVQLEVRGIPCKKEYFSIASEAGAQDVAKALAERLYEEVRIVVDATWDPESLELLDLVVFDIDRKWRDVHLLDVIEQNDGLLPVKLTVESTADLEQERFASWDE